MNPLTTRRATPQDLEALVSLVLEAARQRSALEPELWPMHPGAAARVRAALARDLAAPERRAWFVAQAGEEAVGTVEVGLNPAPPVYDLGGQPAGLLGETCFARVPHALPALLDAAEAFVRGHGAAVTVATCPARDPQRLALLQERGYRPLTLWMVRSTASEAAPPADIRPATENDLPALVRLNAQAQEEKRHANARFWTPHPDAPARFEGWMRHSLTLADRELLVSPASGEVRGFVVAQPAGLPPAHDAAGLGLLDDLAADDWATFTTLLSATQAALARMGKPTVQAICPADWPERHGALEAAGFRTANLWLIRDEGGGDRSQPASPPALACAGAGRRQSKSREFIIIKAKNLFKISEI